MIVPSATRIVGRVGGRAGGAGGTACVSVPAVVGVSKTGEGSSSSGGSSSSFRIMVLLILGPCQLVFLDVDRGVLELSVVVSG